MIKGYTRHDLKVHDNAWRRVWYDQPATPVRASPMPTRPVEPFAYFERWLRARNG